MHSKHVQIEEGSQFELFCSYSSACSCFSQEDDKLCLSSVQPWLIAACHHWMITLSSLGFVFKMGTSCVVIPLACCMYWWWFSLNQLHSTASPAPLICYRTVVLGALVKGWPKKWYGMVHHFGTFDSGNGHKHTTKWAITKTSQNMT